MTAAQRSRATTSALTIVLAFVLSPSVAEARLQPSPGGRVTVLDRMAATPLATLTSSTGLSAAGS